MIVTVDTSAVLAVAAGEPVRARLVEAVRGADLIAPASLPIEVGNALSAMFKRGRITLDQARLVLAAFRRVPIRLIEIDLSRSVALAHTLGIYAYDAYVIDCALAQSAPLLSLDGGQKQAASQAGASLHPY